MATADDNPYRSPRENSPGYSNPRLAERLKCPVCKVQTVPFWKVYCLYLVLPLWCPRYSTRLHVAKFGFGRCSSFVLGIPCGLIGAFVAFSLSDGELLDLLGGFTWRAVAVLFAAAFIATLVVDYLVDRHYVYVQGSRIDED